MTRLIPRLVLFVILLKAGISFGQDRIEMPDGSPVPATAVSDGNRLAWITYAGKKPRYQPSPKSNEVLGQKAFGFMQSVVVLAETPQKAKPAFVLVGRTSGEQILEAFGWIEKRYALENQNALVDDKTRITSKAMIITPEDILQRQSQSPDAIDQITPLREAPDPAAKLVGRYPWFSYLFVFAKADGFVLLGSSPYFQVGTEQLGPAAIVKGWVPERDVVEWNTREAFWWDHETANMRPPGRTSVGRLFEKPEYAYLAAANQVTEDLFREQRTNGLTPPPRAEISRFPRLSWSGNDDAPAIDPRTNNRLHYVGWVASLNEQALGASEIQRLQAQLKELRAELNRIDVLFLIDDTLSMKPWFARVRDIVNQFRKEMAGESAIVRLSVCYFNDRSLRTNKHEPRLSRLADLKSEAARAQLAELADHQEVSEVESDPREMLYDGLELAIEKADFEDHALKLLIVVGVTADKVGLNSNRQQISGELEKKIAKLLKPDLPRPIELYAVQVCDTPQVGDADKLDFELQVKSVREHQTKLWHEQARKEKITVDVASKRELGGFLRSSDPVAVTTRVLEHFRLLKKRNANEQQQLELAMRGNWHTAFSPDLIRRFRDKNIDIEKLRTLPSVLYFRRGFAWECAPDLAAKGELIPQMREWVLMSKGEIDDLRKLLDRVLMHERGFRSGSIDDVINREIEIVAGDASQLASYQSIGEAMAKLWGLSVRSRLLNCARGQKCEITEDDLNQLRLRRNRLEDIFNGQVTEWISRKTTQSNGKVVITYERGQSRPMNREYPIPGSTTSYYWIDVKEELP